MQTAVKMDPTNLQNFKMPFDYEHERSYRLFFWILVIFTLYAVSYSCLSKIMQAFIIHRAVPTLNKFRLIHALWRVFFSAWIITLFSDISWDPFHFHLTQIETTSLAIPFCNNTSDHQADQTPHTEMSLLVAPVSFFLHEIYIAISRGTEPAVFSMWSLAGFCFVADFLKCPNLCLKVLLLLALNIGTLELAKAVCALKSRYRGFQGPPASLLLRFMASPLFVLHVVMWAIINFYLLPVMILSMPSITQVDPHHRLAIAYVNFFLLLFARHLFFESPAWSLVKLVVKKPSGMRRLRSILSLPTLLLLPYSSSLLPELRAIQLNFLLNAIPTSAERRRMRKRILSSNEQGSTSANEDKTALLSVLQCVKILKRKMRYRYEQKTSNETHSGEQNSEATASVNESSTKGSEAEEVIDIFIPVPAAESKSRATRNVDEKSPSDGNLEVAADSGAVSASLEEIPSEMKNAENSNTDES